MKERLKFSSKEIFFTADIHYGHGNIIKYCPQRWQFLSEFERNILENGSSNEAQIMKVDYESIQRMNDTIINNINNIVDKNSVLWILGDVGFFKNTYQAQEFRNKINCQRLFLIKGNHDHLKHFPNGMFEDIYDQVEINVDGTLITLNHYAMLRWNQSHRGSMHFWGHSHTTLNSWINEHMPNAKMLDVGVDGHNFCPWSMKEINDYMKTKEGEKF